MYLCFRFEGGDLKVCTPYIGGYFVCVWDRVLFVIQGTVAFTTGYSYYTVQRYPGEKKGERKKVV